MDLSVIIVNWNSAEYVQRCLSSVIANTSGLSYDILIVDNASYDGCAQMVASRYPQVQYIQSVENLGFGRANNLGAANASGEYLLFLNPDTELTEDSLTRLHSMAKILPNLGAIGCRLLNKDGSVQTSCVQSFPTVLNQLLDSDALRTMFPRSRLWGMAPLHVNVPNITRAEVISGACLLVRRTSFIAVGGFNETFFMYGEDLDLCRKFVSAGMCNYHFAGTRLIHYGGGSSGHAASDFSTVMMRDAVFTYFRLNRGRVDAIAYRACMFFSAIVRLLIMAPLMLLGRRVVRHGSASFRKWTSILTWTISGA